VSGEEGVMAKWVDDIVQALEHLGGVASLGEIYKSVRAIRRPPHPESLEATVRNAIESHSSHSRNFRGNDLFFSVNGLGGGVWGLRSYEKSTPPAADFDPKTMGIGLEEPHRVSQETYRILRDTKLARQIKLLYKHECQLCGEYIELSSGERYSEAHHIRPLGAPHNGPDVNENIIILCPNHHVMFDYGVMPLDPSSIRLHPNHKLGAEYVAYHNQAVCRGR
jgi:hypothetical protein